MIPFPVLSFQEPNRYSKGLWTLLTWSTTFWACISQDHSLWILCLLHRLSNPSPPLYWAHDFLTHVLLLILKEVIYIYIGSEFCHTLKWKGLGFTCLPHPIPPPTSLPTRSLQVLPEHQVRALVSCIQPGPVICFTLDSIHVSMLFSWNTSPSPSPTESKRLFYKSVSLFLFCI